MVVMCWAVKLSGDSFDLEDHSLFGKGCDSSSAE